MILTHFHTFPGEIYSWTSKFMQIFCQNPGKAFTPCWRQKPLAVLLLPPVSIARCIPAISLVFTSTYSLISSTKRELQCLFAFWVIPDYFDLYPCHFLFHCFLKKVCSWRTSWTFLVFWVMSQLDLAILTSAPRYFAYNPQLFSPTTKFCCFLEALCLPA